MVNNKINNNAAVLEKEIEWFVSVLDTRLKLHFGQDCRFSDIDEILPPLYNGEGSLYSDFIKHYNFTTPERIILVLSLIPNIKPQLLDVFLTSNTNTGLNFTEFGGVRSGATGGFFPTIETAMFVIAGDNLEKRFGAFKILDGEHFFSRHNILHFEESGGGEIYPGRLLKLSREYIDFFTTGYVKKPNFGADFPAKLIDTSYEWDELVLERYTMDLVTEIKTWIDYKDILMDDWGLKKKLKPGYRSLFYGPPGTGKTLTASLLGKMTGRDVYRIDLSTVISKYIGETEKNLEKIFKQAEFKNWILFFDEADALFGKRTNIADAHDKFANQEVSYLLQRVEDFDGVVILASNFKSNLDEAFTRRFQSVIHFPMPKRDERLRLWKNAFSTESILEDKVSLDEIADKYELSGGSIMNIIRYSSLMALKRGEKIIMLADIIDGIKREFQKEGKIF